jgi:D-lactate dehydrogenase (cytochrome)
MSLALKTTAFDELRTLLGERFSTAQAVRDHHARDESHHAPAAPDAVVFPASTEEVSVVARICHAHRVPMIPFGAGSGLEGAVQAVRGGISIDLSRMDAVLSVNAADMDATVQAGVRRRALNSHLRDTGLFFPVDPGADASIGGMSATRASGTNAVRFGTMRENVMGLTVVLADGEIIKTGGRARKSSAGYDLTRLFVGSEGTLGIITEVTLRLHPIPESTAVVVASFPSLEAAVGSVVATLQMGLPIGRVELLDEPLVAVIGRHTNLGLPVNPTLFFEFQGSPAAIAETSGLVREITQDFGALQFRWAEDADVREKLWDARRLALGWAKSERAGARSWPGDVCVPISALPEVLLETRRDLDTTAIPSFIVGHVGDGNFHCVFMLDPNDPAEEAAVAELNSRMVHRALKAGGTSTGEHGVGLGKRAYLEAEHGAPAVAAMRALKTTFDPYSLLNPGKILP